MCTHSFTYKQSVLGAFETKGRKNYVKFMPKSTVGDQPQFTYWSLGPDSVVAFK